MTVESKRTPGPWTLEPPKNRSDWFKVRGSDKALVAELYNGSNARLIASAPELLAHLKAVARALESEKALGADVVAGIREIISRATAKGA